MTIIAVAGSKGGIGKTTSSLNIAGEMKPQQVIDKDVSGGLSILNNFRDDNKKLPIRTPETAEELLELLQQGEKNGWLTIIDCGGFDSNLNRIAIASSDLVIIPSNENPTELIGLRQFEDILIEVSQETGRHITGHVFLSKVNPNQKHFVEMENIMEHASHLKLLKSRIPTRSDFTVNQKRGLGVTELIHSASTSAGKEMKALCEEMRQIIENGQEE